MKKLLIISCVILLAASCKNNTDKQRFTVTGEIKNTADQKIFLEELYMSQRAPEVLDTAEIKNGKFTIGALAAEEGLYRLRLEKDSTSFIFINDKKNISFSGDADQITISKELFNTPVNIALAKFIGYNDSIRKVITTYDASIQLMHAGNIKDTDSSLLALKTKFETEKEALIKYCFKYADTTQDPVLAVFTVTAVPIDVEKLELPLQKLATRFPKSSAVATALLTVKQILANEKQQQSQDNGGAIKPGVMAPEITMTDTSGKTISLSSFKGKYVLVDFWASWCPPCRKENPNVVRIYNNFKTKNFTILGVSMDEEKDAWVNAINKDKLTWPQVSNLQPWGGEISANYGFDAIPFNVLIDPQGKVIATALHGDALESKLTEVLK